ncbi:MAG TPA: class I SAM-dependent methyltransferase [Candidatus Sulfotelmatobacter sp.]|nr:class I SAM-dependent methyltransferase [Candidatus Sulfotelmatobacter sp.]
MSRATQSELLEQRIVENTSAQGVDLATWIFERVRVQPGARVLELCCGTGGQTLPLLERVGNEGSVVALDISRSALDTLMAKAGAENGKRLTCVEANIDEFSSSLLQAGRARAGVLQDGFDLIFCAYGLYYSSDAQRTLREMRSRLKREGRIVMVGPFGPNNRQLFDLVRASGVVLSEPVVYSSERFMLQTVLPWSAENFASTSVHTMVNPVRWSAAERVLNYWQNTTFYDAAKREPFEQLLRAHFAEHQEFVNEKWVMLVEMSHGRS